MRYRELSLKYNHEVYLYNEGYLEDLYHRFPELRDTFLFPEADSPCLIDTGNRYQCCMEMLAHFRKDL